MKKKGTKKKITKKTSSGGTAANKVWGYDYGLNDFTLFASEAEWEAKTTVPAAKRYLTDHLRVQLTREVPVAIRAFMAESQETKVGVGFWTMLRMTFTPISFLGALYKGSDTTAHAVEFVEEYVGRRGSKPLYLDFFPLVFVMYRHGIVHAAMPKVFERPSDGKVIGWKVTFDPKDHLKVEVGPGGKGAFIGVCPEVLYGDLLKAIDAYIADFDDPSQTATLLTNFKKGFLTMATVFTPSGLPNMGAAAKAKLEACLNRV